MQYIWVSDRLSKQRLCAWCGQPFGAGYLRDIGSGLAYCQPDCQEKHVSTSEAYIASYNRHRYLLEDKSVAHKT